MLTFIYFTAIWVKPLLFYMQRFPLCVWTYYFFLSTVQVFSMICSQWHMSMIQLHCWNEKAKKYHLKLSNRIPTGKFFLNCRKPKKRSSQGFTMHHRCCSLWKCNRFRVIRLAWIHIYCHFCIYRMIVACGIVCVPGR